MTVPISSPANSVDGIHRLTRTPTAARSRFASVRATAPPCISPASFPAVWRGSEIAACAVSRRGPGDQRPHPGRVDVMFSTMAAVLPLVQGGRLRGLAVTTAQASTTAAPQLPTDRGIRAAGFRRVLVVRGLRAGADARCDHPANAFRRQRGACRAGDHVAAGGARRDGGRLDPAELGHSSSPRWTNGGRSSGRPASDRRLT